MDKDIIGYVRTDRLEGLNSWADRDKAIRLTDREYDGIADRDAWAYRDVDE